MRFTNNKMITKENPKNLPKLNSSSYKIARKSVIDNKTAAKRLKTLLIRIITRIDKITIFLGQEELDDKELKTKISLLSQLIGVKKQVSSEIKELEGKGEKNTSSLSDILH